MLEEILPQKHITDFEVTHQFSSIGKRTVLLNALEITRERKEEKLILLSIEDITERKNALEIIKKTGERFSHLVKELPAAVYSCDAQGRLLFYNEAAVKLWGRKPEIGKDLWGGAYKILSPDGTLMPADKSPMAIALKEGRAINGDEIIIERPDGTRSVVKVYPQPEFGLSGEITGVISMAFDVTEQVRATNKLKQSESAFATW
ncbi:MAG: PAS domain S-box protein [Chitinophagaceae bacterium]|nr:PAS domain S-box protein [Chitinophagaceae bacterium]